MDEKSNSKAITIANGFAAFLSGVAFCLGLGMSAPVWVAAAMTVLSIAIATVARVQGRRNVPVPSA